MPDLDYIKSILAYCPDSGIFTWKVSTNGFIKIGQIAGTLQFCKKRPDKQYYKIGINGKLYMLHRLAFYYVTSIDPAENQIDHINGNGLDNRFDNLRLATHFDNGKNRKKDKDNTSGFKGVSWYKHHKVWRARITVNKKSIFLGYFHTPEEASAAYQSAAELHFKDYKRPQTLE